jgi:adenylate cyclase
MRDSALAGTLREFLDLYAHGMEAYYARAWEESEQLFMQALELRPDDYPSLLHLERVRAYTQTPPPAAWDGVFVMKSK